MRDRHANNWLYSSTDPKGVTSINMDNKAAVKRDVRIVLPGSPSQ